AGARARWSATTTSCHTARWRLTRTDWSFASTGSTRLASGTCASGRPTTPTWGRSAADELDLDRAGRLVGRGLECGRGLVQPEAVRDQPLDRRSPGGDQLDRDVEVVAAVDDAVADRERRPELADDR